MEINSELETILTPSILPVTSRPGYQIAKWISRISSPPLLIVLGLVLAAMVQGTTLAWLWVFFYTVLVVLIPAIYIVWKVRRGEITDFHMKIRQQRTKPLLLSLICTTLGWIILKVGNAPSALVIFGGVGIIQMAFIFLVTLKWKISGHSATVAGFTVFVFALFGWMPHQFYFLFLL
jgi:hypothetical protein